MKFIYFANQFINLDFVIRIWMGKRATHGHSFVAVDIGQHVFNAEYNEDIDAEIHYNQLLRDIGLEIKPNPMPTAPSVPTQE